MEIAQKFLIDYSKEENKKFKQFSSECQSLLLKYNWPGNVRQLQNIIRNSVVLNDALELSIDMLPKSAREEFDPINLEEDGSLNAKKYDDIENIDHEIAPLWQIEKKPLKTQFYFVKEMFRALRHYLK
ncbi:MAG: hypothetical protein V3V18_06750 [Methylococcales bacterium]